MSIFSLFNQKKDVFTFDLNYDIKNWGLSELPQDITSNIKQFQIDQKNLFDNHIKFITKNYNKEFRKDKSKIKKSCLEFAVLYLLIFNREFNENNFPREIGMTFLIPIYNNFRDLEPELKLYNYQDLSSFFFQKASYLTNMFDNPLGDGGYFHEIFISNPIKAGDPLIPHPREMDAFKTTHAYFYASNIIKVIDENSKAFISIIQN
jgi:hypothetical protein